jgi:8-oxo-dGTP pyrophosphatase MutT (NUDIX family)
VSDASGANNAMSEPVPVRDAATVLLLRAGPGGGRPQVWMLTRVAEMAFAAGASVFPGGRVDADDGDLPWSGRPAERFAAEFDCPLDLARALVGAAVRETFEETGVLLTTPAASMASAQPEVESGRLPFGDLLTRHGLAIDADLLRPWSRWITPRRERNRRRYDTRFFVAHLPAGAEAADLTSESVIGGWITPAEAMAATDRGERHLMPPTRATLESIAAFARVDDILAAASGRSLAPERPHFELDDHGHSWVILNDGQRIRDTRVGIGRDE